MHDGLGEQIVEQPVIAALGGGIVDLEQRFGLGAADRLMLHCGCGENARAPGGVVGIQRAGEMNTAPGGRSLAGDDAVADDGEGLRCGFPAGNFRGYGGGRFGRNSRGRHWYSFLFLFWS